MISKELLSLVQNDNSICNIEIIRNTLSYDSLPYGSIEVNETINIHELAHKCKEWAINKNFLLDSNINGQCSITELYFEEDGSKMEGSYVDTKEEETEPEAIFKACEWILTNGS